MGKTIFDSLLAVQNEIANPENTAHNPFTNSNYAPLSDILNIIRPLLTKNDLILIQNTGSTEEGLPFVQTELLHSSGDSLKSDKLILQPDSSGRTKGVQKIGSAITYGRRYQIMALLGIINEKDDDGNSTGTPASTSNTPTSSRVQQPKPDKSMNVKANQPKSAVNNKPKSSTPQPKPNAPKSSSKPETSNVVNGETQKWKQLSQKNPAVKKVCDNLNNAGLELHNVNVNAEAADMNRKGTLTDPEYNKVLVVLGKAPG